MVFLPKYAFFLLFPFFYVFFFFLTSSDGLDLLNDCVKSSFDKTKTCTTLSCLGVLRVKNRQQEPAHWR